MHPKHKWEMPFKSRVLRAYIRVARIIRIVRFLLANKYLSFFRDDHNWTANALKGAVFGDHEVDVTLDQCYKAKRMAFKMIHGAEE